MSMFTPAPWTTEPHGSILALYSGRDENLHGLRIMNLEDGDWNFEANIRLIKNAPELYNELICAVNTLTLMGHDTTEAKKILAKVRGE